MQETESKLNTPHATTPQGTNWNTLSQISSNYLRATMPLYFGWSLLFMVLVNIKSMMFGSVVFQFLGQPKHTIYAILIQIPLTIEEYICNVIFLISNLMYDNTPLSLLEITPPILGTFPFMLLVWWFPFYTLTRFYLGSCANIVELICLRNSKDTRKDLPVSTDTNKRNIWIISFDLMFRTFLSYILISLIVFGTITLLSNAEIGTPPGHMVYWFVIFSIGEQASVVRLGAAVLIFLIPVGFSSVMALIWAIKKPWFGVALQINKKPQEPST